MSKKFQKKSVVTIAASHTLHDVFSSFYAPLIPLLMDKLGFNLTTAGLLSVVQKVPSLFNPIMGIIADKLIIRWFLILSPLVTTLAMSLVGVAPSVFILGVLLFITGFSAGVYHTTAPVIMKQVSGEKTGTGMSIFMFGGELARTLGPLIIIGAVSIWGLEGVWRLGALGIIGSAFLYFQLHKLPDVRRSKTHSKEDIQEPIMVALGKMKPLFFIITPMLLFRAFSKTALTTFLPTYLVQDGLSLAQAGMILSFLQGIAALATLGAGTLSDKIGRKRILVVIMILSPLLMFLFTLTSGIPRLGIIAAMGVVFFASTPVFMAMVHDMNSHYPALANGMFMTLNFAMSSIVSLLIGFWGDTYGLHFTYKITAILTLGAIPFALMIKSETKKVV